MISHESVPLPRQEVDPTNSQLDPASIGGVALYRGHHKFTDIEASHYESNSAHLKELFAPVVPRSNETVDNYDSIFASDEEFEASRMAREAATNRPRGREFVTDENRQKSVPVLIYALSIDRSIEGIILADGRAQKPKIEIVDDIRTNAGLRLEVGKYLLDKVDKLAKMPNQLPGRIVENGQKKTKHLGYPGQMTSREFTVLLALSMLDGSFDYSREDKSKQSDNLGQAVIGQHREAARKLLESESLNKK